MEASAIDAHDDPSIGEQDVGLLECLDILISRIAVSIAHK